MHEPQFVPARNALPICSTETSVCRRESRATASTVRRRSTSRRRDRSRARPSARAPRESRARSASASVVGSNNVASQVRDGNDFAVATNTQACERVAVDVARRDSARPRRRRTRCAPRAGRARRRPTRATTPAAPRPRARSASSPRRATRARYDARRQRERLARQREAVPLRLVAAHAHGRALELRLSRDRIDGGRNQRADARVAREHAAPVHRHERLPRCDGVRDLETHDDARRRPCATSARSPNVRPKRAASSGWSCTNGSAWWPDRRGDAPVRVIVCHWSRTRPVFSTSG